MSHRYRRHLKTDMDYRCPPISPNPNSPNPCMLGLGIGLGLGLGMGLGIGLGSGFEYFRQYNVIRRIGIRRNGAEPDYHYICIYEHYT